MFSELFQKLSEFESHHQVVFAIIAIVGIVALSWGTEKILEEFIFHKKGINSYILSILLGIIILLLTSYIFLKLV